MKEKSLNLTSEEIIEITGKHRPSVQFRVLNQMAIPVKKRLDGKPIVCRQTYMRLMGAFEYASNSIHKEEPDFSSFLI
jgi:uncharacterized protein DUF4224